MIALVLLLGLLLGTALNAIVALQLRDPEAPAPPRPSSPLHWTPVAGALAQRQWLALFVEILTALMAVVLWQHYGWSLRFGLLLAASLVLIDTAVVDWRVRLIDTLIMVVATLGAVIFAPVIIGGWLSSLLGLFVAGLLFLLFFVVAKIIYPSQQAPFGLGDVYLSMFIGALVGLFNLGPALLYGMIMAGVASIGIIVALGYQRARHVPISYGSFLCLGALLYLALFPFQS